MYSPEMPEPSSCRPRRRSVMPQRLLLVDRQQVSLRYAAATVARPRPLPGWQALGRLVNRAAGRARLRNVEAQPCAFAVPDAYCAEFAGVLVYRRSGDAQDLRELLGVNERRRSLLGLRLEELNDSRSDRLHKFIRGGWPVDVLVVITHYGGRRNVFGAYQLGACAFGKRLCEPALRLAWHRLALRAQYLMRARAIGT